MRISDWSSDVCSSDLTSRGDTSWLVPGRYQRTLAPTPSLLPPPPRTRTFIQRLPSVSTVFRQRPMLLGNWVLMMSSRPSLSKSATSARGLADCHPSGPSPDAGPKLVAVDAVRSEEHTSELQSLM